MIQYIRRHGPLKALQRIDRLGEIYARHRAITAQQGAARIRSLIEQSLGSSDG